MIKKLLKLLGVKQPRNQTPGVLFVLMENKERKNLMWFEDKQHRTECLIKLINTTKHKKVYTQLENETRWYEIDLLAYKTAHPHYFNKLTLGKKNTTLDEL